MAVPLLNAEKRWECPSCGGQHVTHEPRPHVPMHPCKGLGGLLAPFVEVHGDLVKGSVQHRVVEREDYVGDEQGVPMIDGRPIMAVRTERADGSNDVHVFPGTATGNHTP